MRHSNLDQEVETIQQPMTVVAGYGRNHVYFYEVDHVPESEEFFNIGVLISKKMMATIGQKPQRWKLVRRSEFDPEQAAVILQRDPIRVT